jgi:hypothetical protein
MNWGKAFAPPVKKKLFSLFHIVKTPTCPTRPLLQGQTLEHFERITVYTWSNKQQILSQ